MTATWTSVCATGHRPQHLPREVHGWVRDELYRICARLRDEHGTQVAISGAALGVDLWYADAAHRARLTLAAYIPCPPNPRWNAVDRAEYDRLLALADPALSRTIADRYTVGAMFARNTAMLEASDAVVAVWAPLKMSGGTYTTVRDAARRGLPVIHVNPDTRRTHAPGCACVARLA